MHVYADSRSKVEEGEELLTALLGKLKSWLTVQALEDERIERLMASEFPEAAPHFTLLGDVFSEAGRAQWTGSTLEGRWEHDRPGGSRWRSARPDEWARVLPLVEAAWAAPDSDEVTRLAQQILDMLAESGADEPEVPKGLPQPSASGANADQRDGSKPQPIPRQEPPSSQDDKEAANASEAESEPEPQAESTDSEDSTDAADGEPGDSEDTPSHSNGEAADDGSDTTADQEPAEDPSGLDERDSDPSNEEGDEAGAQQPASSSQPGAPQDLPDMSALPDAPEDDTRAQGIILADGVEGYARSLAPLIRPPERPGGPQAHRSRGRFRYDRHVLGREKTFEKRGLPSRPQAIMLHLLLDRSGSMLCDDAIGHARKAALMLARAANLVGSRFQLTTFGHEVQHLVRDGMTFEEAASLVAGVQADGMCTILHPALIDALNEPYRLDEVLVIPVICDGRIVDSDFAQCRRALRGREDVRVVPVLIAQAVQLEDEWREAFGSALVCPDVSELAARLRSFLAALRCRVG